MSIPFQPTEAGNAPSGSRVGRRRLKVRALHLFALLGGLACAGATQATELTRSERLVIDYVEPKDASFKQVRELLISNRVLEAARDLLAPIRWPRTIRLELRECGEANAWYGEDTVTVCYEYVDEMLVHASSSKRPAAISREDAFIGPLLDVYLHEAGHAMFDLLAIPVLGREEDAADQLAAYYMLQLPGEKRRNLIIGSAYSYASALKVRSARDLKRPRIEFGRHTAYADEHGTPAQRLYNLLCIAYGSDKELFADVVSKGYLPESRAEMCEGEYRQVQKAFESLVAPHIDRS
jgi:hypothetical protein